MQARGVSSSIPVILGALLIGGVTLGAYSWYKWDRVRHVTILYGADLRGELDPCECGDGKLGGLPRRGTFVEETRRAEDGVLLLDAGGIFFPDESVPEHLSAQLSTKADSILAAYERMGYDAIHVTDVDAALGRERLASLARRASFPVLSSGSVNADSPFQKHTIRTVDGVRVGILAVGGPPGEQDHRALAELVAELRPRVDVLVGLSHQGLTADRELARAVPGIDILIGGRSRTTLRRPEVVGETIILQTGTRGGTIGRFDLVLFDDGRGWVDASESEKWKTLAAEYREVVRKNEAVLASTEDPSERYAAEQLVEKYAEEVEQAEERVKDFFGQNHYVADIVPLNKGFADHPEILDLVERYKADVRRLAESEGSEASAESLYLGAEACKVCHEEIHASWKETRHARAFATLEKTSQEFDLECIGCHTTGYRLEGGFTSPAAVGYLKDVQCEVCHGPGAGHPAEKPKLPLLVSEDVCVGCHTKKFNENFDFREFWARIAHDRPGLESR